MSSSRSRLPFVVAAMLAMLALPAGAQASGSGKAAPVDVTPLTASTEHGVTITAIVRTEPYVACHATVSHDHVTKALRALRTSRTSGTGRWQWDIAAGVRAGVWSIRVSCWTQSGVHDGAASIRANRGPPGRAVRGRLFAPHSVHADDHGTGSGGADNPYPRYQCTWWAWLKRPDLPYFPGIGGDALNWARSAAARGIPTGRHPVVGAIAVFPPHRDGAGYLGHVAYVERVDGARMTISEAAFGDASPGHRRTLPWRGLAFVYGGPAGDGHGPPPKPAPPAPPIPQAPGVFVHHVVHTCLNGRCGLPEMTGPGYAGFHAVATLSDGRELGVVCQRFGESVRGIDGSSSAVWDELTDGGFVADYFVDTPERSGGFSPPIPRCVGAAPQVQFVPGQPPPPPAAAFHVHGTCAGDCTITARSGPGVADFAAVRVLHEGDEVDVACQLPGEQVGGSGVWDLLADGGFLGDAYVDTPASPAGFSTALPHCEQEGHQGVNTFTDPTATSTGQRIGAAVVVQVSCKLYAPQIASVNPDGYWYRIASSPWSGNFYAPANTFMNGDPWNGPYSRNTDFAVADC